MKKNNTTDRPAPHSPSPPPNTPAAADSLPRPSRPTTRIRPPSSSPARKNSNTSRCTTRARCTSTKTTRRCTCASASRYLSLHRKIQNRESARRVRLKEKDQSATVQTKVGCLQEENQRLQIENSALKSENAMLRNQVAFMERLLLSRGGAAENPEGPEQPGLKRRTDTKATGGGYFLQAGMLGVLMLVSYLPEGQSSPTAGGSAFQQRVLAEVTSGFHLFAAKSFAATLLALIRSGALLYGLVVIIIGISCGIQHHKRRDLSERLMDDYGQKKDS